MNLIFLLLLFGLGFLSGASVEVAPLLHCQLYLIGCFFDTVVKSGWSWLYKTRYGHILYCVIRTIFDIVGSNGTSRNCQIKMLGCRLQATGSMAACANQHMSNTFFFFFFYLQCNKVKKYHIRPAEIGKLVVLTDK